MTDYQIHILRKGDEVEINVPWLSDLRQIKFVTCWVSAYGINLSATSTLNDDGIQSLQVLLDIANGIYLKEFKGKPKFNF